MRPAPAVAGTQFGAFTTSQARCAGWTPSALRNGVAQGHVDRLRVGAYGVPIEPSDDPFEDALRQLRRAAAAVGLTNPGIPLSHNAAAVLHGIPLLTPGTRICASPPRNKRGEIPGVHVHDAALFRDDVGRIGRLLLTSPARTVVDMGGSPGSMRPWPRPTSSCAVS